MPVEEDAPKDNKIIEGDFRQETTKKNKVITENLDDPALKFTTEQWCDAFEMWQEIIWDRLMDPSTMNMPDEAMAHMRAISKQVTPEMRLGYEKQWKVLKKDLMEYGLHGAEFFTTVCSEKPPGYEIHRNKDDKYYMFIGWDTWQAVGQKFFDWYGQQCNAINPVLAIQKLLKEKHGITTEQQFLDSDLGRDGLIANPF